MKKSFVFILSLIEFEGDIPIEVIPKHFFQKANNKQISRIKELLYCFYPHPFNRFPYEYSVRKIPKEKPDSFEYEHDALTQEDWRYWIISFEGYNSEIKDLGLAAALLKNELEFGFTVLGDIPGLTTEESGGYMWNMPSMMSYFLEDQFGMKSAIKVYQEDIMKVATNYTLIKEISAEHKHIQRAIQRFDTLKSLPRKSELLVIGLFSVIESLITHRPELSESSDSLVHQIRTKMPLLRKYFERKLDYEAYFDPANEAKIWSKLYDYRSRIVHGEPTDIDSKLQILKSGENILDFLHETVKLLIICALQEPVLLKDLKSC